jgi:putative PEP-CTERM system TPR-repeat lipoprotein
MATLDLRRRSLLTFTVLAALVLGSACAGDPEARKQKYMASGDEYFNKEEYSTAIIEYRNAIGIDARFGKAHAKLAESYLRAGDPANALSEFARAADLLPDDFDVNLKAGVLLLAAGRPEDALGRAEVALKLRPQDVTAHVLRGNALAGLKSFDEALKAIEEAIRLDPERGTTITQKAFIELASGRREEAERTFKRAVEIAPKAVEGYLALGNYYWALGRLPETEQTFRSALKIKPDDPSANRAMAALAITTGRTAEAEQYLRTVADTFGDAASVVALANYYLLAGRSKDAIDKLTPLATGKEKVPGTPQLLARAYALSGDRGKARELVDTILETERQDVDAQLLKAQLLYEDGQRDAAISLVKATVGASPASVEAQLMLGKLHVARGDVAPAEEAFREVLRLNPRVTAAQVELSRLLLATGRTGDSLRSAEEAARNEPRSPDARLALVRSLLVAQDTARAQKEISTLLAEHPDVAEVQAMAGVLAVLKNDVAGGRAAFERALSTNANSLEALSGLVALDLRAKDNAGAIKRIDSHVASNPRPEVMLLAARTHAAAGDPAGAERFLRRVIETDASMLPAYAMLGELYLSQKRLDEARKEFDSLAARQTRPVAALTMSGIILQTQGQIPQARQRFEKVLAIDSRAPVAANNLAWLQAEAGEDLDVALQLAQAAVSASPDTPEITDTLGWIYYKKNLPQQAIPQFERSVSKEPGNATFHYHLGLAYLQAGDADRGRASLRRALSAGADAGTAAEIKRLLSAPDAASARK